MKAISIAEESSSSDDWSRDPADDETYLQVHHGAVYLATINLAVSEAASNNKWTAFLRFLFPKDIKISKHWGIVIRDTLYELARDGSATLLQMAHWPRVRDRHDEPMLIGTTTLNDEEILAIAKARFSKWPKHGYSVTFSNCQCFCYRFTWYVCDETRFSRGNLNSAHLPARVALVQGYLLCGLVAATGMGWAAWMKNLWWPVGWDTLIGILFEAALYFLFRTLYTGRESLGGWHGSEAMGLRRRTNPASSTPLAWVLFATLPMAHHIFRILWNRYGPCRERLPRLNY